ncbi:MAG: hypothetical protein IT361_10325 [Gemmatimonadaceae bacterium]|nr:hypothetical protein [Gemmatimonadaceae bacterium]
MPAGKAYLVWLGISVLSLAMIWWQQPRDARLWLMLLVAVGSIGMTLYSWNATH